MKNIKTQKAKNRSKNPTIRKKEIQTISAQGQKPDVYIDDLLDKFYIAYHNKDFEKAIHLLDELLLQEGQASFWIYSRKSSCYYELKDYKTAVLYAKKAYKLQPNSPLVLWDYAGPLIMLKKEKKAIELLMRIQDMEEDLTQYGFSIPDIKWMRSIKNDANFLIGKAYYTICEDNLAKEFLLKHLSNRGRGKKSIYQKKLILKYLKKIDL